MSSFRNFRNTELSAIEYIRTQVEANFTGVTVVKTYKQATKTDLPVVCVRLLSINPVPKEIGTTTRKNECTLVIDIFATSDGQRLDLASLITDSLNDGFIYYEFSKTSGTDTLESTANGRVRLLSYLQNQRLDFGDDVHVNDKFRHIISVVVEHT